MVPPSISVVSSHLLVPASSILTQAVTLLENSTSLQSLFPALAMESNHPNVPMIPKLISNLFIGQNK